MNFFSDLRLAVRMGLGFGGVLLLLCLVVGVSALRFDEMDRATDELVNEAWAKAQAVKDLEAAVRANGTRTMELLITDDAERQAALRALIAKNRVRATEAIETLHKLVKIPEGRQILGDVITLRQAFVQSFERVDAQLTAGDRAGAVERVRSETVVLLDRLVERTTDLEQLQGRVAQQAGNAMHSGVVADRVYILLLGAGALALGLASAWGLTRSVSRPVREAVDLARRIAAGDLSATIRATRKDEVGDLLRAMGDMNTGLARVVGTVRGNAESVATASTQIAQGNLDLSQRTEQQAAALQQTAASMEQLAATVRHNTDGAQQASRLAQAASQVAGRGGEAVGRVVDTMLGIHDGSKRIGDIIGTIDGIAFQTNILALNAAVEAARAGEQGRGFAVVASEVRSLAQRSAAAAREIKVLISTTVEQVEQGSALAREARATMDKVVDAIRGASEVVDHISTASAEQSRGVQQVGEAVGQMDQVTQQNAALVEESAAAAESLKQQARGLVAAVAAFRLGHAPMAG